MNKTKHSKVFYWVFVAITLFVVSYGFWVLGKPMIEFASEPEKFRLWVNSNGVWGRIVYLGMMITQIIAAFLPGEPFELLAGYAFGAVEGTALCFLASAIGSCFILLLVRKFGIKLVGLFFSEQQISSVKFLKSSPKRILLFSLIFILPGTPKDLLCYFVGITDIKLWILMVICTFGRLPAIVTSTLGGDALGTESYIYAIVVLAITLALSCLGVYFYGKIKLKNKQ